MYAQKTSHQDAATTANIVSGCTVNKNRIHPHCIIETTPNNSNNDTDNESNVYSCEHVLNSEVSFSVLQASIHNTILHSENTDHYLHQNSLLQKIINL